MACVSWYQHWTRFISSACKQLSFFFCFDKNGELFYDSLMWFIFTPCKILVVLTGYHNQWNVPGTAHQYHNKWFCPRERVQRFGRAATNYLVWLFAKYLLFFLAFLLCTPLTYPQLIKSPLYFSEESEHNQHTKTRNRKQTLFSTIDCDEISAFLKYVKVKHKLLIRDRGITKYL